MANADTPFGARPPGNLYSSNYQGRVRAYTVLATDAVALFYGDLVRLTGTSGVGQDGASRPVVAQYVAGTANPVVGVVQGFAPDSDNLNQIYRTASTMRTVYVADDPGIMMEMQCDGDFQATDVGSRANVIVGSGDTVLGISGMEIQSSSIGAAGAIRLMNLSVRPDNDFGTNAKVICQIYNHAYNHA